MITVRPEYDVDRLMAWRQEVIRAVFGVDADTLLLAANLDYYRSAVEDGSHRAFVAEVDGKEAGCGALCLQRELPSPDNPTGVSALVMNVYVREKFRKNGVGYTIVSRLIDEARSAGAGRILLETTDVARKLYGVEGFVPAADFMQKLV